MNPILSILIPSLSCRLALRTRVESTLRPQIEPYNDCVEGIVLTDDGESSIGAKRNKLVSMAKGDYICFVDDDDLVSADYVAKIVRALKQQPDCVGFRQRRMSDGKPWGEATYSIRCDTYHEHERDGQMFYFRTPNHLTPIRAELVRQCPFPDSNAGEDHDFAQRVYPLLKSEVFIDEYLYTYLYRTPYVRRDERVNQQQEVAA